jgi:hypothetical protein
MLWAEQRLNKDVAMVSMQLVCHVVVVREGGVQTQRGIPTSHHTQEHVQHQQQHEPQEKLRGIPLSHQTQERVQQQQYKPQEKLRDILLSHQTQERGQQRLEQEVAVEGQLADWPLFYNGEP